jgi:hypothetical protein
MKAHLDIRVDNSEYREMIKKLSENDNLSVLNINIEVALNSGEYIAQAFNKIRVINIHFDKYYSVVIDILNKHNELNRITSLNISIGERIEIIGGNTLTYRKPQTGYGWLSDSLTLGLLTRTGQITKVICLVENKLANPCHSFVSGIREGTIEKVTARIDDYEYCNVTKNHISGGYMNEEDLKWTCNFLPTVKTINLRMIHCKTGEHLIDTLSQGNIKGIEFQADWKKKIDIPDNCAISLTHLHIYVTPEAMENTILLLSKCVALEDLCLDLYGYFDDYFEALIIVLAKLQRANNELKIKIYLHRFYSYRQRYMPTVKLLVKHQFLPDIYWESLPLFLPNHEKTVTKDEWWTMNNFKLIYCNKAWKLPTFD